MNRNKIVILSVAFLLVIGAGFGVYKVSRNKGYSIVYLTTREVYIGKLTTFPRLVLTDAYLFQTTPDPTDKKKNNFQLTPLKDALWAPQSLRLVKDNILFYGPLSPESQIAKTLSQQAK